MSAVWIVQRTGDVRFPYRIAIEQAGRVLFAVRAKAAWPGAGTQVFCLREREPDAGGPLDDLERAPVLHLSRLGRKLSVALDRPRRKRCEFLILEKPRRDGGSYEQVFFRTEAAVRAHKTSKRAELSARSGEALDIVVDSLERYPWSFPGANVQRRRLPVGDYALAHDERPLAIVERKTLDNLLGDLSELKGLHQQLSELAAWPHAALVIEAQYADFGNPAKVGRWPTAHLLRVLGELPALFPRVQCIFAGNRKLANVWAQRWFGAVHAAMQQPRLPQVAEAAARYRAQPADGGLDARIRIAALRDLPDRFEVALLRMQFPEAPPARVKCVLDQLRAEGCLRTEGRGRGTRWCRAAAG
ncbi:ERCC4 domain-containing protein [Luteimonas sp. SJ-92]|uniref:ERCC4 domain-containing protein n=1 Tax=Luteimonas salinisoli TaxID=2752307 RepID=A0A853JB34_9GAMM|nr:ERCC4 domain-containing protein [Luteimonas salinisoli]NZA26421.1 ERCC4 domain-containing protein [Luteimonas salinisoli]